MISQLSQTPGFVNFTHWYRQTFLLELAVVGNKMFEPFAKERIKYGPTTEEVSPAPHLKQWQGWMGTTNR